jgi:hypothetical protein
MTGVRRYVAIPPEQLREVASWTVLFGALIPDGGIWRTGAAVLPLRPSEADMLADHIEGMAEFIVAGLSGTEPASRAPRPGRQRPHGVLIHSAGEAPPEVAAVANTVIGGGLGYLVEAVLSWRNDTPQMINTDGDRMCLVTAHVTVSDPARMARQLAEHPDIDADDEDEDLVWWGRPLTAMKSATATADMRAQLAAAGAPIDPDDGYHGQRWMRGQIRATDTGLRVKVNSKERLARFLDLLRDLGEEPLVAAEARFDPALDLPIRRGGALPFHLSDEAMAVWAQRWLEEPAAGLGGRTPRRAAARPADRPMLEALLRELEHDADLLTRQGMSAPNVYVLRKELDTDPELYDFR